MADKTILTPGYQEPSIPTPEISVEESVTPLIKENSLSEFLTDDYPEKVKGILNRIGIPSYDDIPSKKDLYDHINHKINHAISAYELDELRENVNTLQNNADNIVTKDGTVPFEINNENIYVRDLATKEYLKKLLEKYLNLRDIPKEVFAKIESDLTNYVLNETLENILKEYYTKEDFERNLFTDKVGTKFSYVHNDGSTPFTKPLQGVKPLKNFHLATKGYVDDKVIEHLIDPDPHSFTTILKNRLSDYVKTKEVYPKTQTYSRDLIDSLVNKLVESAVESVIQDLVDAIYNDIEDIRKLYYVKSDGTTPFTKPLRQNKIASKPDELTTFGQVTTMINDHSKEIITAINSKECVWRPSGPAQSTVGFVEDDTPLSGEYTLQEIMDAIFYGKGITITADELVSAGQTADITVCVLGSTAEFNHGELYQNGELIYTFEKDDFEKGCKTVSSNVIKEDTLFIFIAYYDTDSDSNTTHQVDCWTKISMPIFIGLIPYLKPGTAVTYSYLMKLWKNDKVNNNFYDKGENVKKITHQYSYMDSEKMKICVAVPNNYPDLTQMTSPSQLFDADAFDLFTEVSDLMFVIPGTDKHEAYKLYLYKEPQVIITNSITFNFATNYEQ